MELKEFIAYSIAGIVDGMLDARDLVRAKGVQVSPNDLIERGEKLMGRRKGYGNEPVNVIEFEVGVSVSETTETSGGAGLALSVVRGGIDIKNGGNNATVNTLRFSIPITYPRYTDK